MTADRDFSLAHARLLTVAMLIAVGGCAEFSGPTSADIARFEVVSGWGQQLAGGGEPPQPVRVRALDGGGHPLAHVALSAYWADASGRVHYTLPQFPTPVPFAGAPTPPPPPALEILTPDLVTDDDGIATVRVKMPIGTWTDLFVGVKGKDVVISASGIPSAFAAIELKAVPGPPSVLMFNPADTAGAVLIVGDTMRVRIWAFDQWGNVTFTLPNLAYASSDAAALSVAVDSASNILRVIPLRSGRATATVTVNGRTLSLPVAVSESIVAVAPARAFTPALTFVGSKLVTFGVSAAAVLEGESWQPFGPPALILEALVGLPSGRAFGVARPTGTGPSVVTWLDDAGWHSLDLGATVAGTSTRRLTAVAAAEGMKPVAASIDAADALGVWEFDGATWSRIAPPNVPADSVIEQISVARAAPDEIWLAVALRTTLPGKVAAVWRRKAGMWQRIAVQNVPLAAGIHVDSIGLRNGANGGLKAHLVTKAYVTGSNTTLFTVDERILTFDGTALVTPPLGVLAPSLGGIAVDESGRGVAINSGGGGFVLVEAATGWTQYRLPVGRTSGRAIAVRDGSAYIASKGSILRVALTQ